MTGKKSKPRESLRTRLMAWLLGFSIVPVFFITGISIAHYEKALDQELLERLRGNRREVQVIFEDFERDLQRRNALHADDKTLIYYLSSNQINAARDLVARWMRGHFTYQVSVFNREGRLEISMYQGPQGEIKRNENIEGKDVYLTDGLIQKAETEPQIPVVEFTQKGELDLVMFSKITSSTGNLVGYIEETLKIEAGFVNGLTKRLNIELLFFSKTGDRAVGSDEDLVLRHRQGEFLRKFESSTEGLIPENIRGKSFGFVVQPMKWGGEPFFVGLGASKETSEQVLKSVKTAFFTVVVGIVLLLVILSFFLTKWWLQPVNRLLDLVQNIKFEAKPDPLPVESNTELGILTDAFNEMLERTYNAQSELKDNIKKLEVANIEIRETQAKLVHAAKMAGLGQLVAGVAHELDNPISFIYSNMTHLRDYGQRLISLVETAEKKGADLTAEKAKYEFDYLIEDLPKLIRSCEEGAKRTRDIVLGLRSFSRLDEAQVKEVDIHESIDATLALLSGEFKSRVKIHKTYGKLPKITCYASQLNQVFMNVLSNAGHAIAGNGDIYITTSAVSAGRIKISIRDTGQGMSDEIREKIFDPFFTTKDVNQGTGLGMSITYSVIQKHQGEITVNSKLGEGTEFIITLPINLQS